MESYFDGYLPVAAGVRAAVRYEKETFFMSDTPNEKKFMREKVVKPPIDKRRAAGRILCYVLFAAVFGGVAAVSFVASLPTAKKLLGAHSGTRHIFHNSYRDSVSSRHRWRPWRRPQERGSARKI